MWSINLCFLLYLFVFIYNSEKNHNISAVTNICFSVVAIFLIYSMKPKWDYHVCCHWMRLSCLLLLVVGTTCRSRSRSRHGFTICPTRPRSSRTGWPCKTSGSTWRRSSLAETSLSSCPRYALIKWGFKISVWIWNEGNVCWYFI